MHDFVSLRGSVCNRALLLRVPAGDPLSRTRHTNDGPNEALAGAYTLLELLLLLPAKRLHFLQLYSYISSCQIQTEWSRKRQSVVDCQGRRHTGPLRIRVVNRIRKKSVDPLVRWKMPSRVHQYVRLIKRAITSL